MGQDSTSVVCRWERYSLGLFTRNILEREDGWAVRQCQKLYGFVIRTGFLKTWIDLKIRWPPDCNRRTLRRYLFFRDLLSSASQGCLSDMLCPPFPNTVCCLCFWLFCNRTFCNRNIHNIVPFGDPQLLNRGGQLTLLLLLMYNVF